MDDARFDRWTRALSERLPGRVSRRMAVTTAALGAAGLISATTTEVAATAGVINPPSPAARCRRSGRTACGQSCVNLNKSRKHCGRCGRRCASGEHCQRGRCRKPATQPSGLQCGTGGACRVFVTSSAHTGDLGGLAGADKICARLARDARLPGKYLAWLSTGTTSPSIRFTHNPGPYVRVDGTVFATDWATLTSTGPLAPLNVDETGATPSHRYIWSNTHLDGTSESEGPSFRCYDWTSSAEEPVGLFGDSTETNRRNWTIIGASTCANSLGLYCFQQSGPVAPVNE